MGLRGNDMMRIKKCMFLLFIVFIPALLMGSSHDDLKVFEMPEEFDENKNYEITFWAKNDTNITQKQIYQKAVDDFKVLYPNIDVTLRSFTNYNDIYNEVITNISTKTTPNVCISYPDHVATYLTGQNTIVPLNELMDNEKYGLGGNSVKFTSVKKEEIVPSFLEECYFNDNYYTLPFMRSTEACYVNKTYVESLGYTLPEVLTWDFVWEVSEKAKEEKKDIRKFIPFIYKSTDNMMIQMLMQKNAPYSTDEGEILVFSDETKELLETIATHSKSGCFSTFKISSYPGNYFNAGNCIFAIDSTAGATWIGSNAPLMQIPDSDVTSFETEVMMIPQFDTENPKMISQGPSVCIFNKEDPQEVLASWLFTQFLLTNDVQIAYSKTEGYVPVTTVSQNSSEYQDYLSREGEDNNEYYDVKIKASKLLLENTENTFVTPVFNGSASLRDASGQLIEEVVKAIRSNDEIDNSFYRDLYKNIISLYNLGDEKMELGKLPTTSIVLLSSLGGIWVLIIAYVLYSYINKKRLAKNKNKVD